MNTAQPQVDLKTRAFGESLLTQLEDPESELSSYFSTLSLKFVLENLEEKDKNEFLELLEKDQNGAFEFASEKISDFGTRLANYLEKHLSEIKDYSLSK